MPELSSAAGITAAATASVAISISVTIAVIISFSSVSEADSVAFCKALGKAVSGRIPAAAVIPATVTAAPVVPSPVIPVVSASAAIRKAAHILKISFFSLIL